MTCIEKEEVKEIVEAIAFGPGKVGLFRNRDIYEVADIVVDCGLDHVQLHGDEMPEYCDELKDFLCICPVLNIVCMRLLWP